MHDDDRKAERNLLFLSSFMLKKTNRLTRTDVENLFKTGKFVVSPNLTFKYMHISGQTGPKISFITPKTTSKLAVKRNLLRRRGYVAIKGFFKDLPPTLMGAFVYGKKGLAVFGGKKTNESDPIANLHDEIAKILNKIN